MCLHTHADYKIGIHIYLHTKSSWVCSTLINCVQPLYAATRMCMFLFTADAFWKYLLSHIPYFLNREDLTDQGNLTNRQYFTILLLPERLNWQWVWTLLIIHRCTLCLFSLVNTCYLHLGQVMLRTGVKSPSHKAPCKPAANSLLSPW